MVSSWKDNVVYNFDRKAVTYDKNCDIQKMVARHLADDLPDGNITDILEIGCGTGNLTRHLIAKYPEAVFSITDISTSMINSAKNKFTDKNIYWQVIDGENIETSKRYDLIIASMVFQWFENIENALSKLSTMLKPDGLLLYSVPGPESFKEWRGVLRALDLPEGIIKFNTPDNIYKQEMIEHNYDNAIDFLGSIKKIGAGHARKNYVSLSYKEIKNACDEFDRNHGGKITWHILYGRVQARN